VAGILFHILAGRRLTKLGVSTYGSFEGVACWESAEYDGSKVLHVGEVRWRAGTTDPSVVMVTMVYQNETGMLVKSVPATFFSA